MGSAPKRREGIHPKLDGKRPQDSHTHSAARKEPAESGLKTGAWFDLGVSQLAQVAQAALDHAHAGAVFVGPDSRIRHANPALASLLGYSQEELAGRVMDSLILRTRRTAEPEKGVESRSNENRKAPVLCDVERKSGDTVACHIDSKAIRDENGNATHFLAFFTESPASKDAEEASVLEKEIYRAESLQTLGMLAGGVAHDFNNALEVIIGFATLARIRLSPKDPLHEPLKIIEESAKGAADLARRLLDVSKDGPDDVGPVDAGDLIGVVASIITRTFDRKIRIESRIAARLPSIKVNRSRLQQAILNLCLNARDAMQKGGTLAIESDLQTVKRGDARLPASMAPGQYVRVAVRDTGEGMPAEVMKRIFVPQFTTKGRGYGHGLAMVDRIVKEAQGFISVSSQQGKGSEFSLYLPAAFDRQQRGADSEPGQMIAGRGHVLVVDDEPRVLEFLEKGLTRLGYKVETAESGSRACEIYSKKSDRFNCVLLDLIMPGMSGLETYSRLKNINPAVKVILSSGYSSGRVRREAVEAGNPDFLNKPFTLEELSQALQKIQQN